MMRSARWFRMAGLCALGLFVGATAVQAQATKLLPSDTEVIVTVNFQQILKSDILKDNKALVENAKEKVNHTLEEKGLDKWLKKADFDLFRDLTSLTYAISAGKPPTEGFIVLEGKFDVEKIEAAAKEASKEAGGGLKISKLAGVKVFEVTPPDEKTLYVGILGKKTMIVTASKEEFEGAVARAKEGRAPEFKAEGMKALMSTVNAKQSISLVATSDALAKLNELNPNAGNPQAKAALDALKQLDGMSMAVTLGKDIDFQVGVNAKNEKTAKDFAAKGNAGLGFLKAMVKDQAENNAQIAPAVDVVNSIRISTEGVNLLIRGQVTAETLGKLLANLPGMN